MQQISSFRSEVEVHHYFFVGEPHKDELFTEASTNTVFQLTGYGTLTDIRVLARVAGHLVEVDKLRQGRSGMIATVDRPGARIDAKSKHSVLWEYTA